MQNERTVCRNSASKNELGSLIGRPGRESLVVIDSIRQASRAASRSMSSVVATAGTAASGLSISNRSVTASVMEKSNMTHMPRELVALRGDRMLEVVVSLMNIVVASVRLRAVNTFSRQVWQNIGADFAAI